MVRYPNDELIRMWEADKGNKPTDDISDLHKWAAARIAELERLTAMSVESLAYIRGIAKKGSGEEVPDSASTHQAILGYVMFMEQQLAAMTAERDSESRWAKKYSDEADELRQQLTAAQERERWIPISDGPPENIRPVLVRARNKRGECFVLRASYAHKRELEIDSDDYADGFADHDEDNDIDYCPDGWYEWNYTDEVHYYLGHLEITHWRELPAPPAEKE